MKCCGCGNEEAYEIRYCKGKEECDHCGNFIRASIPDVYFREPYTDVNLIDVNKPETKDGTFISSRRAKAEIMRRIDVHEAGDRVHGAR